MFERFTDRARRVVVLAQEEARRFGHNYVGTEHLLLGLVREGDGVAARVLVGMGVELEAVRQAVEQQVTEGGDASGSHIPFTPRAKAALELSLREALTLGHNYIGTEHILLGLVREGHGVASQILTGFGVDASRVRSAVMELLTGSPVTPPVVSANAPSCPLCKSPLEGRIGWSDLSATGDDEASVQSVRVFYCRSCEGTLGLVPISDE